MKDITLLDGSIGQELVKRAGKKPTAMWSTAVLIDQPNLVREVHNDYFSAGASVATTNTYPVLKDRLEREGLADQIETLWARAVQTACAARQAHGAGDPGVHQEAAGGDGAVRVAGALRRHGTGTPQQGGR